MTGCVHIARYQDTFLLTGDCVYQAEIGNTVESSRVERGDRDVEMGVSCQTALLGTLSCVSVSEALS